MKSRFYTAFFALLVLIFQNCQNQEVNVQQDSIYKGEILEYITSYKEVASNSQISKITDFAAAIDFKRVEIYKLRTTEKVIMADMKAIEGFRQPSAMKALFFVNQGKIVRSNIVTFNGTSANDYDQAALAVLNGTTPKTKYSGKVSIFNLYGELVLFNNFNNGSLDGVGFTRRYNTGKNNGRSGSCTDWYLVSYYPNGNVTSQHVFTTCDYGCQFYRMGRTNCGGGGEPGYPAAGGPPALPINPINGAIYEYTDQNGEYRKYQYDSASAEWKIVERILPAAVVVAKRDEYPFLDLDWPGAYHGQIVFGTDNMVYTFGSDGNWRGEKLEFILPGIDDLAIDIEKYLKCFGSDQNGASYKVSLYVLEPNPGTGAEKMGFNVGHTFVGLTKIINGNSITQYIGFYPENKTLTYPTESKIESNDNYSYSTSVTYEVSAADFFSAISTAATKASNLYHISQYNCTTYALDVCQSAGITLPRTLADFPYGYGRGLSPGNLGADLRSRSAVDSNIKVTGGTSGNGNGPCQ